MALEKSTEEKITIAFLDFIRIAANLRKYQKLFQTEGGFYNRKNVSYWQMQMDECLLSMGADPEIPFKEWKINFIEKKPASPALKSD